MPPSNKKKPQPDAYTLLHSKEYGWEGMHVALSQIPEWRVQCADPTLEQNLQQYQDLNPNFFVPGVQNRPPYTTYDLVRAQIETPTVWFPYMYPGGPVIGVMNVVAAMVSIQTAANGLREVTGRCDSIFAYSGGSQTVVSSGSAGNLQAKTVHIFGPVLLGGDLESLTSFDNIYIHRGTADFVGWLGFLELRLQNIPDGLGGEMPGFTITIHSDGGTGRVQRFSWPYDHSGTNGIRENIPTILQYFPP